MKISLREAATLLGKSERQIKYLIAQGKLAAVKVDGRWQVDDADLSRSPAAIQADAARAEVARDSLERALAPTTRGKFFSVTDLVAFRTGVELFRGLRDRPAAAPVRGCDGEVLYLGHRMSRAGARPRGEALRRFERRVAELVVRGDVEAIERSVASYRGVLGIRRRLREC